MKSIKNTTLSCGLLNAPVKIFAASGKEPEVSFNLTTPSGDPVEQIYVEREDEIIQKWVDDRRMVRAFDYDKLGRSYNGTSINQADLTAAEKESLTTEDGIDLQHINIESFIPLKDVPFERATKLYYLGPDPKVSTKSFCTFREALKKRKAAGIAKVVLRSRQIILAVYVKDDIMHAQVLCFAQTMNDRSDSELHADAEVKKSEVLMMGNLIDAMMDDASVIDGITDTYVEAKRELVEKLIDGQPVAKEKKSKKATTKADDSLMDSLEASVKAANARKKAKA